MSAWTAAHGSLAAARPNCNAALQLSRPADESPELEQFVRSAPRAQDTDAGRPQTGRVSLLRSDDIEPYVRVSGSRVHNLRAVDLAAPRDAFVAFTGVSGSGKSSLAFGTIYAEAQRRYFESVAPYARRLLLPTGPPKVDDITGLR
jgi:ABC-type glutathione transport system ATPase component